MQLNVGIITVSDRASKGLYDDLGGPALQEASVGYGWTVLESVLVPDEIQDIQRAIRSLISKGCALVLTTGGTGVALRDVTPEAVREIAIRELPGFGEQMRMESLKITPTRSFLATWPQSSITLWSFACRASPRCGRMPRLRGEGHPPLRGSAARGPNQLLTGPPF